MADFKLAMSTSTKIDSGRQYVTKEPTLEMSGDLTIGDVAQVLQWMMHNGIPSSSPIQVTKKRGKFYISSEHTTSDKMPSFDLSNIIP